MNTTGNYTTNQGDLTIEQSGENVNGKYSKTGVLEGSISGNIITGIWKNSGKEGLFEFVFSDGLSFKGKYKIGTEPGTMRSKWDGQITNLNNTEAIKDKTTEEKNDVKTVSEKKNGVAKWVDEEGNIFDGTWENDILIKGIITYYDGSVEQGEFNEEELNGKGKCSYKDDDGELIVEEGEFLDGNLIKGTINWENGSKSEGEFNEDGLNGNGIITFSDGSFKKGTFKNGEFIEGIVKMIYDDGTIYEGGMKEEIYHGQGKQILPDGNVEEGVWNMGDLLIEPKIHLLDLSEEKEINFNSKIKYDNGTYIGSIDPVTKNRHGYGAYIWNNGNYYEGEWVQNNRTGKGIFIWPNGRYYSGDFIDGKRTGLGKEWDNNNYRYATGRFVDGIPENPYRKDDGSYVEKNLSSDLSAFFQAQERCLTFLKTICKQIVDEMPKINCENSNPLLRNISVDFQCSVFVYSKNSKYFTMTFDVIKLIKPSVQINLESIFSDISPKMINEISQSELNNYIQENVNSQVITSKQFIIDSLQENIDIKTDLPHIEIIREKSMLNEVTNTDGYHPIVVGSIYFENIDECREDTRVLFMGLGLIEQSIKKRSVHDKETYWKLTEKGNQMMVDIKMKKLM
jgi:hypothetical protein